MVPDTTFKVRYTGTMISKPFGRTGVLLPVIGQGTWGMGENASRASEETKALRLGIDLGMTHIDTAEMYGGGRTEDWLKSALAGLREKVFLTSKVLPSNASYSGTIQACERSLRRMGTDRLDLYLLHWSSHYPIEDTMRALEDLVRSGKTRFVGVSNLDTGELREAEAALSREMMACNQVCYHMKARGIEFSLIPHCADQGIAVVGYSPFGNGPFVDLRSKGGEVLQKVAAGHGKTPRQVALNFLSRLEAVFTIPKAATPDHVRENAGSVGLELTPDDLTAINAAFPPPTRETPLAII
jgi:diketogulonate reductase-like aldo/keto reductase